MPGRLVQCALINHVRATAERRFSQRCSFGEILAVRNLDNASAFSSQRLEKGALVLNAFLLQQDRIIVVRRKLDRRYELMQIEGCSVATPHKIDEVRGREKAGTPVFAHDPLLCRSQSLAFGHEIGACNLLTAITEIINLSDCLTVPSEAVMRTLNRTSEYVIVEDRKRTCSRMLRAPKEDSLCAPFIEFAADCAPLAIIGLKYRIREIYEVTMDRRDQQAHVESDRRFLCPFQEYLPPTKRPGKCRPDAANELQHPVTSMEKGRTLWVRIGKWRMIPVLQSRRRFSELRTLILQYGFGAQPRIGFAFELFGDGAKLGRSKSLVDVNRRKA